MKKVFALMFVLLMGVSMVSCSSDDDSPAAPQFSILGTWKVSKVYINGVEQNEDDFCSYKGTFQFVSPNTYVENGFEVVGENCVAKDPIGGTWAKSGNTYTLRLPAGTSSTVLPLTFTPVTNSNNIYKFQFTFTTAGIHTTSVLEYQ